MAAEGGSNRAWPDDTEDHCTTFIASLFRESAKQKGGPGNMEVHGFRCFANANDKTL